MAGTVPYRKFSESYLTAEVNTISQDAGWNRSQFATVTGKSGNTIKAWLEGNRIPDKANLAFICDRAGVEEVRRDFILHVRDNLHSSSELVSDLNRRNLYIVESGERTYPVIIKWEPLLLTGLLQTEAYHMRLLAGPLGNPAEKIRTWKRKERRGRAFFKRFKDETRPEAELYVSARAIGDLDLLTTAERDQQIERLLWADSLPGCKVCVPQPPHLGNFAFDAFKSDGRPGVGPNFVYVEQLDQTRHVVDEDKLALYDQAHALLRSNALEIGRFLDGGLHQLEEEQPE